MNHPFWIAHFQRNRQHRPEPLWGAPFQIPEGKRAALARTLAEYQLGDGGGECRLVAADAERFRGSSDDARMVVDLWFAEEREHSRLLGGALRRVRGEFLTDTLAFRLFYLCRRALGVQFEMQVLLLVEIVSTGYYRLIRRHCGDEPIAAMCRLILRDENGHIAFHCDRLAACHPHGLPRGWKLQFQVLGLACAGFLWLGHGRWLRTLGASWRELHRHVQRSLSIFLARLDRAIQSRIPGAPPASKPSPITSPAGWTP